MKNGNGQKEDLAYELFDLARYVSERMRANENLAQLLAWVDDACLEEMTLLNDGHITSASHELRTPLGNVKLYISLLQSAIPARRTHYVDVLYREVDRLHVLVENLLCLSRLERGSAPLSIMPIDLNQLAGAAIVQHAPIAAAQQLALESQLDSDPMWVRGDAQLLARVLSHLIHNAIQFSPPDGSVVVRTLYLAPGGWGRVSVHDSGPGITVDEQPLVFESFYRGRAALESDLPGAGLGLAISKEIVKQLGGRIEVASVLGAGATFSVWLKSIEHE